MSRTMRAILPPAFFRFFPDAGDGDFTLFNQNPSGIVHSYTDGLLTRAADVVLKSVARWCSACVKHHCT